MEEQILVTGANGFVGTALVAALRARGTPVVAAVRQASAEGQLAVGELDGNTDWTGALQGCTAVIHLAARVHVMDDASTDPIAAYRTVNRDASVRLAHQAHACGVRRFVFVSSIKVNGEATTSAPFRASDLPAPCDPYGQSKLEAEQALLAFGRESGMEIVIVRPPLVYGPGVKANFNSLLRLVKLGVPLPFGRVSNARSMVALDNLVDLLMLCTRHPAAPGQVFLVSDGRDLSIGQLVGMIAAAMHKHVSLLPVPAGLMRAAATLLGKGAVAERLFGSLQVDIGATCDTLGWHPPISPEAAIGRTVAHFVAAHAKGTP